MDVMTLSGATPSAAASAQVKTADTVDTQSAPASAPATDTVSLSPAAQQALASPAAPTLADTLAAKAAATTDKGLAQFYGLAATVLGNSATQDQQLDAFVQFKTVAINADWQTSLADYRSVYNAVTQDSAIGQKAEAVTQNYNAAAMRATQSDATNNDQGIAKAQLDAVNAMSDFDRKVLFESKINDAYSEHQYDSQTQWLSSLQDKASGNAAADTSTPFAQNSTNFYRLAAVITDTSGKYSQDDQLTAYNAFMKNSTYLQFKGAGATGSNLMNEVCFQSTIGQLVQNTYNKVAIPTVASFVMGDADNGPRSAKAQLNAFNALSDFEKKVYFETSVNADIPVRSQRYTNMQQWVDQLTKWAGGTADSASKKASGSDDPVAAYAKQVAANGIDTQTYLAEVKQLFGINTSKDKPSSGPVNQTAAATNQTITAQSKPTAQGGTGSTLSVTA